MQAYNAALPSEEEINDYAHKMSVYKTITNGGVALKLRVLNKGTAKATDIRISIVFPKDIFVDDRHANVRPGRPRQGEHRPNYDRHDRVMNDQLFKTFYNNLKKEPFEDDRMALLNTALANSDFTSAQCLQVTKLYTFDDDRMAIMKKMYPRIVDKEAFFTVIATLTFSSNKDEMNKFVQNYGRR